METAPLTRTGFGFILAAGMSGFLFTEASGYATPWIGGLIGLVIGTVFFLFIAYKALKQKQNNDL